MCGRYQAWVEDDELMRIIEREKRGNIMRYFRQNEVFPGSVMPVLYGSYSTVRAHLSLWGYDLGSRGSSVDEETVIDRSGRRGRGGSYLINARSETAASKPLFRDSVMNAGSCERRVVIITSGYFEWNSHEGARKIRYHIGKPRSDLDYDGTQFEPPRCEPLLLCGLETSSENSGGENGVKHRHVILTTAAFGSPSRIHHRMPLFLRREEMEPWLYDTDFAMRKLKERVPCDLEVSRCDF